MRQGNVTHLYHHCGVLPRRFRGWWGEDFFLTGPALHCSLAHMSQDESTRQWFRMSLRTVPLQLTFTAKMTDRLQRESTSSLTETPFLLALNVSDCAEVLLQPRFIGVQQCRVVKGTTMSHSLQSDMECNVHISQELYADILLSIGARSVQQEFMGKGASGFYEISPDVMKCDAHIAQRCRVSGGTTMFRGIVERMTKELTVLAPSTMKVKRVH